MKKLFLILWIAFFFKGSPAQTPSSVEGKIIDAKTREPLPGATVYLASTAIGTSSNVQGKFSLGSITSGKYDLTVSMIGYKTFSRSIVFFGNSIKDLIIYLDQKTEELAPVEVKEKKSQAGLSTFKRFFIGPTANARHCKVTNLKEVYTYQDDSKLYAWSHSPIEIINNALGYRIIYELKEFTLDNATSDLFLSGILRFEDLVPKNEKQQNRWIKARDLAYYGSIEHFIRSLKKKELAKNRFQLYDLDRNPVSEEKLFVTLWDSVIVYRGYLKLVFTNERQEFTYSKGSAQESTLNFSGNNISLYANGVYQDFHHLIFHGYMGWSSAMSEMVPYGYQPTHGLDGKKLSE